MRIIVSAETIVIVTSSEKQTLKRKKDVYRHEINSEEECWYKNDLLHRDGDLPARITWAGSRYYSCFP